MDKNLQTFLGIMLFYILLSYIIFPLLAYFFINKTLETAGNGFIAGSIVSILLWQFFGKKMV